MWSAPPSAQHRSRKLTAPPFLCSFNTARRSLTDEPMDEPARLLPEEVKKAQLAADAFVALRHGATLVTAGGATLNTPALLPVGP